MTTRTITGTTPTYPNATIRFRQLHAFVIASATYLTAEYATVTSAAGAFTIAVPVPDTGTVAYLILLPDGMALSVNLAAGAATTLEVLIATDQAVVVQSALQTAIDAEALARETAAAAHAALRASTTVFGHAAVDGTSITSVAGVLSAAGGAPTGAAGGVLSGTYPNPGFASDMATQAELNTEASARDTADLLRLLISDTSANGRSLIAAANYAAMRTLLALVVGTDVQAYNVNTAIISSQALTDGASIAWDVSLGAFATVTLGGNRTLANPTNLKAGASYAVKVTQDGTGTRTLAYGSAFKWAGGAAPVLSTAINTVDILTFISDGTNMYGVLVKAWA